MTPPVHVLAVLALTLTACTQDPYLPSSDSHDETGITCQGMQDCTTRWRQAQQWLMDNTRLNSVSTGDNRLETRYPGENRHYLLGYTLSRHAVSADSQRITLPANCPLVTGCYDDPLEKTASFYNHLEQARQPSTTGQPVSSGERRPAAAPAVPQSRHHTDGVADVTGNDPFAALDEIAAHRGCTDTARIAVLKRRPETTLYELGCNHRDAIVECSSRRCRVLR